LVKHWSTGGGGVQWKGDTTKEGNERITMFSEQNLVKGKNGLYEKGEKMERETKTRGKKKEKTNGKEQRDFSKGRDLNSNHLETNGGGASRCEKRNGGGGEKNCQGV